MVFLTVKVVHFYFICKNEIQKRRVGKGKTEKEERTARMEEWEWGSIVCLFVIKIKIKMMFGTVTGGGGRSDKQLAS